MRELKCLFAENLEVDRTRFRGEIERAWERLDTGVSISIDEVSSPEEVTAKLSQHGDQYHLLFVDILYGDKDDDPRGIQIIIDASAFSKLGIIALSNGTRDDEKEAIEAGAHAFIPKQLFGKAAARGILQKAMLQVLHDKGHDPVPTESLTLTYQKTPIALKAVIETIKPENVISLAYKLLKRRFSKVEAKFVTAGLSGAFVLRVDCYLEAEAGKTPEIRKLLLKMSRDREMLVREYSRRQDNYSGFGSLFVQFVDQTPADVESHGWYALGGEYKENAKTLLEWLLGNPPINEIDRTLRILFLDAGLKDVYSSYIWDSETSPNEHLSKILTTSRAARIELALDELGSLGQTFGRRCSFSLALIENFIFSGRVDALDGNRFALGTRLCKTHGDLHSRNILVDQNGLPKLIDPANIEQSHWAADIARLIVDLIVTGLDAGTESHKWNKIKEWYEVSQQVIRGEHVPTKDARNAGVTAALDWLRGNLFGIHSQSAIQPISEWEFKLSLAVEFLRASYRQQDLPSPKRVLGLIAACEALRRSSAAYTIAPSVSPKI
jgi:hypothetical protein